MCLECVTPASKNYPVFFTVCEKCEQLTDHRLDKEETLLMCETCNEIKNLKNTEEAIQAILNNRLKVASHEY
jgi:translation initiation factor 2 beta subunit (eIF-2beta)/eIF-5